jgi:hypothetical protein
MTDADTDAVLVLSRYNEDLGWIRQLASFGGNIIVYNKGEAMLETPAHPSASASAPRVSVRNILNVGREGETYLHYIIKHYDRLPEHMWFAQADPFPHSAAFVDFFSHTSEYTAEAAADTDADKRFRGLTTHYTLDGNIPPRESVASNTAYRTPHHNGIEYLIDSHSLQLRGHSHFHDPPITEVRRHFRRVYNRTDVFACLCERCGIPPPERYVPFTFSACFYVHRRAVLRHPKEMYQTLREFLLESNESFQGYVLERFWAYLFTQRSYSHMESYYAERFFDERAANLVGLYDAAGKWLTLVRTEAVVAGATAVVERNDAYVLFSRTSENAENAENAVEGEEEDAEDTKKGEEAEEEVRCLPGVSYSSYNPEHVYATVRCESLGDAHLAYSEHLAAFRVQAPFEEARFEHESAERDRRAHDRRAEQRERRLMQTEEQLTRFQLMLRNEKLYQKCFVLVLVPHYTEAVLANYETFLKWVGDRFRFIVDVCFITTGGQASHTETTRRRVQRLVRSVTCLVPDVRADAQTLAQQVFASLRRERPHYYDYLFVLQKGIWFKPAFYVATDRHSLSPHHITVPFVHTELNYAKPYVRTRLGNPLVCDCFVSFPKPILYTLPRLPPFPFATNLLDSVGAGHRTSPAYPLRCLVDTYHHTDPTRDWNPLYTFADRPECRTHAFGTFRHSGAKGALFPRRIF